MAELREFGSARLVLRQTEPMLLLKTSDPVKYGKLEALLGKTYYDAREVYPENVTKEKKRSQIAQVN